MDKNTRMKKGLCKSIAVAFVCLLLVISPFAMAEEIASVNNTKENLNASIDGSDEIEWQVVWQDETETAIVESGESEWVWFVVWGIYWAYTAYTTYEDVQNGDYASAAMNIAPIGKINKVAKLTESFLKNQKRLTATQARQIAEELGFTELPRSKIPKEIAVHNMPAFKKGNIIITPDRDGHGKSVWKVYDTRGNRLGSYDAYFNWIRE